MKRLLTDYSLMICFPLLLIGCSDQEGPTNSIFESDFIVGEFAYVPFDTKLMVVDISDPTSPKVLEGLEIGFRVTDVVAKYPYLYVAKAAYSAHQDATETDGGILKFDISSGSPMLVDRTAFPPFPDSMIIYRDLLYVSGIEKT